ncbi:MAG: hypothetical protein WC284_11045 [Candidimonas sp.]
MKNSIRHFLHLLGMLLALTSSACLALSPGEMLSQEEVSRLGQLPSYDIDANRIRVIPPQHSGSEDTLLLNEQDVVGISQNEVVVSEAPDNVQAVIQQTLPQPVSITHFAPTGITLAKYADFAQSVQAMRALKAALPDARIGLAVQFGRPVPQ